jgi:hypothetical protein
VQETTGQAKEEANKPSLYSCTMAGTVKSIFFLFLLRWMCDQVFELLRMNII